MTVEFTVVIVGLGTQLLAFVTALTLLWREMRSYHQAVNSRLDLLLEKTDQLARAEQKAISEAKIRNSAETKP